MVEPGDPGTADGQGWAQAPLLSGSGLAVALTRASPPLILLLSAAARGTVRVPMCRRDSQDQRGGDSSGVTQGCRVPPAVHPLPL